MTIERGDGRRQAIGLWLGPVVFGALLLLPAADPAAGGIGPAGLAVAATAAWMAIWWISEAIPIPATALLPIAVFPVLGVMGAPQVTASYANHLIYLFLGGFLIAMAMQRWNLHRRLALLTIWLVGVSPRRILLGFMLATAFLSMWISNTATAMMMVPIGMAVAGQMREWRPEGEGEGTAGGFGAALMLGIAYSASIGGVATLIGTPPNAILAGVLEKTYGQSISFAQWLVFGLPLAGIFLALAWAYLAFRLCGRDTAGAVRGRDVIGAQLKALGRPSRQEWWVLGVFVVVALAWILRGFVSIEALRLVQDSTIAIMGGLALFLIPAGRGRGAFLLDWASAVKLPWDIVLLFGGGFALAEGFAVSGLTEWLANQLRVLAGVPVPVMVLLVGLLVVFLTEVTSNTATATLLLPVAGALAQAMGMHPYGLMVTVAVAASFAFMLPVATPPNAIVFGSRYVTIPLMARAGWWLNLLGAGLLAFFVSVVMPWFWGIELAPAA